MENTIDQIISNFAETHHFIQQMDIDNIENGDINEDNFSKMHGKPFVLLDENESCVIIHFGKIKILIDNYKEEESYGIDMKIKFSINVSKNSCKEKLIEDIIKKCKHHKLI